MIPLTWRLVLEEPGCVIERSPNFFFDLPLKDRMSGFDFTLSDRVTRKVWMLFLYLIECQQFAG